MWIAAAFLFCPCHLPLTLALLAALLAGSAAGALLDDHPLVAGAVLTILWILGTWRGFVLLRRKPAGSVD